LLKCWSITRTTVIEGTHVTVLELRTHPGDLGKVIGREGQTAKAIRTLLGANGMNLHKRFTLEIVEEKPSGNGCGKRSKRSNGGVWEGIRQHEYVEDMQK
jgi:uncharacterized protein